MLKKLKESTELIYGEVYFIETNTFGIFRIVRKNRKDDKLSLQTLHPEKYDDIDMERIGITGLFRICAAITNL